MHFGRFKKKSNWIPTNLNPINFFLMVSHSIAAEKSLSWLLAPIEIRLWTHWRACHFDCFFISHVARNIFGIYQIQRFSELQFFSCSAAVWLFGRRKKLLECGLSFTFGSESSQLSESEVTTSSNVTFFAQVFLWSVSASQDAERSSVQFVAFVEFFFAPFICVVFISIHSYSVVFQSPKWCKPALFWWPFKPLI